MSIRFRKCNQNYQSDDNERSKHIDIRHLLTRTLVQKCEISLRNIQSQVNLADLLTD